MHTLYSCNVYHRLLCTLLFFQKTLIHVKFLQLPAPAASKLIDFDEYVRTNYPAKPEWTIKEIKELEENAKEWINEQYILVSANFCSLAISSAVLYRSDGLHCRLQTVG